LTLLNLLLNEGSIKTSAIAAIGIFLLAHASTANAQQPTKTFRVGFLGTGPGPDKSFLQGLETLGYTRGKNLIVEYRRAVRNSGEFPELAVELVRQEVDVIYAPSTPALFAAKTATDKIPIVMNAVTDPVEERVIESLTRPGGNITGVVAFIPQLSGKLLELLAEAVSGVNRVGVLFGSQVRTSDGSALKIAESSARSLKLQVQTQQVQRVDEFSEAFSSLTKARVGAVVLLPSLLFSRNEKAIASFALAHRIPSIYWRTSFADAGGFMAYGPSLGEGGRRAGVIVGKILNGLNPAELPVEHPSKFDLVFNMTTAKALGIRIPPALLVEATRVIE
jgi:putative ABC transport system substrate-binding protein